MKYIIFYSWQSDLPNNTNRGFIESVMEKAIKDLSSTDLYDLEPSIDRDTKELPGAPNITQAIIDKIKTCDAFVADISIVTGLKDRNERPSPNPNVLLELGYAIALLGWDKIVLFCNETYGTDENLPFDIRQHRRIGYTLKQDDPKSDTKNDLAKRFKLGLIDLLKKGKNNHSIKQPSLDVFWNILDISDKSDKESGMDSKKIQLLHSMDADKIPDMIKEEVQSINDLDGSIDPKWEEKKNNYIRLAKIFLEQLKDRDKWLQYIVNNNYKNILNVTLSVRNYGTASASDIRVVFTLPSWLYAFDKLPSKNDIPVLPTRPVPERPRTNKALTPNPLFAKMPSPLFDPSMFKLNLERKSACNLDDNGISFWADKILHKHTLTNRGDRFYLLALPDAPLGEYILKGKAFCSEYDDWEDIELAINVI